MHEKCMILAQKRAIKGKAAERQGKTNSPPQNAKIMIYPCFFGIIRHYKKGDAAHGR